MFPGIDTQQRRISAYHRILICVCPDLNLTSLVVFNEPRPAAALNTRKCGVEFRFEVGERAIGRLNCGLRNDISKPMVLGSWEYLENELSACPPVRRRRLDSLAPGSPRTMYG